MSAEDRVRNKDFYRTARIIRIEFFPRCKDRNGRPEALRDFALIV